MDLRRQAAVVAAGLAVGLLVAQLVATSMTAPPQAQPPVVSVPVDAEEGSLQDPIEGTRISSLPIEPIHHPRNATGPNVLLVVTDDQPTGMLDVMPTVRDRIGGEGITFERAYVTTPVCCPSRASILTGQYAHEHGVIQNPDPLDAPTMIHRLHEAGYVTGVIGKYLNSWNGTDRHEVSYWASPRNPHYHDPVLNVNGTWHLFEGYSSTVYAEHAINLLERASDRDRPFFLMLSSRAPHQPATGPESLHGTDLADLDLPEARVGEPDVTDKPRWLQNHSPTIRPSEGEAFYTRQARTLHTFDHQLSRVLDALDRLDQRNDTVVIFLSDNGILHGQHRLTGKGWVYEPSTRVPFLLRYPALVDTPRTEESLVGNIDIAPTLLDLAGLEMRQDVDGRSLVPLLEGTSKAWNRTLLLEGGTYTSPAWAAVHTGRYVYVETHGDRAELYDLAQDPHQLENIAEDPDHASTVERLQDRLHALRPDVADGSWAAVS